MGLAKLSAAWLATVAGASAQMLAIATFPSSSTSPGFPDHPLMMDLGYGVYEGYYNKTSKLNVWKGIRFAAPPVGDLRWQSPQVPPSDRGVVSATSFGPVCPQTMPAVPGAAFIPGDEDCLFLNVYAPAVADATKKLPVLVWIHGGGYGMGDGQQDLTEILEANGNSFVGVSIQYRLGAFGWLSSQDVRANGVVNAGLLDQIFALSWVQNYITNFGGDPSQVTIAGESAGGGSVMYHALGTDGKQALKLFKNGIAASPYLIAQYDYNATAPTQQYRAFVKAAGCGNSTDAFACLVGKDSMTLQKANFNVTSAQTYGTWAFWPVTDGAYVKRLPSVQMAEKKVNGVNMFVGNNADEGALFVPPNIATEPALTSWLATIFPGLSAANISSILAAYPVGAVPAGAARFPTSGIAGPTANDVSPAASGQLQRAYNIYGEAYFVCPSYWLADAFTQQGKRAFHYQYSVPFAMHGSDVAAYFGPATPNQGSELVGAWRRMWGAFIRGENPGLGGVGGGSTTATTTTTTNATAPEFPVWTDEKPLMVNLNQTGGKPYVFTTNFGTNVTQYMGPGLKADFSVVDADAWEGGRGKRCDFWKTMSPFIPK